MKYYKSVEVKTALLLPFLLFISSAGLLLIDGKINLLFLIIENSLSMINIFGGSKFYLFFIILLFLMFFYFLYAHFTNKNYDNDFIKSVRSIAVLILISSLGSIMLAIAIIAVYFLVSPNNVLYFTNAIESLEIKIFGKLPEFALVNMLTGSVMEELIIFFYKYLYVLIPFSMIIIGQEKINFKRAFVGYFFAFSLLIPIWYIFPVISPHAVYLSKLIQTEHQPPNTQTIYDNSSSSYKETIDFYEKIWISKLFFAVSSFPSFHAYLAILFAYYLTKTGKKWIVFSIIWVVFTIIGTFYTLQHYLMDALAAALFALIIIKLLNKFIKEEPYDDNLYYICKFLNKALLSYFFEKTRE